MFSSKSKFLDSCFNLCVSFYRYPQIGPFVAMFYIFNNLYTQLQLEKLNS